LESEAFNLAGRCYQQYHFAMNTATKLLVAMRRSPLDWRLAQLQTVARQYDIAWRHDGGSHCVLSEKTAKRCLFPRVDRSSQFT
jgi:hypothetical protein